MESNSGHQLSIQKRFEPSYLTSRDISAFKSYIPKTSQQGYIPSQLIIPSKPNMFWERLISEVKSMYWNIDENIPMVRR